MGSPVSAVVANLDMEFFKELALETARKLLKDTDDLQMRVCGSSKVPEDNITKEALKEMRSSYQFSKYIASIIPPPPPPCRKDML